MTKNPILPWESVLRKLAVYGQQSQESCHKTHEVRAYSSPRCARAAEEKMREKAGSVSLRQETTTVNYPVQSCAASGTQTSSLQGSMGVSALFCN